LYGDATNHVAQAISAVGVGAKRKHNGGLAAIRDWADGGCWREEGANWKILICSRLFRYNAAMVRRVDAIFSHGAFRPVEAVAIPEGTRVVLSVEDVEVVNSALRAGKIRTPRLADPKDAAHFVMEVRRADDAAL
jgi:predicted DNA-binding antitoxin AbrB/MazE fold protein